MFTQLTVDPFDRGLTVLLRYIRIYTFVSQVVDICSKTKKMNSSFIKLELEMRPLLKKNLKHYIEFN